MKDKLNPKQKKFCEEYLKCFNATEAYSRVYPDSSRAACTSSASDLLSNPNIIDYMSNISNKKSKIMSPEEILEELSDFARKNKDNKSRDFLRAVELLGKYHQMFADRIEVTHSIDDLIMASFNKGQAQVKGIRDDVLEYNEKLQVASKNADVAAKQINERVVEEIADDSDRIASEKKEKIVSERDPRTPESGGDDI